MSSLSITPTVGNNPTLKQTMQAMNKIAPLTLADSSWDNVGLLVEAENGNPGSVMLAIDLTTPVCQEILAAKEKVSVAVVYHPIIFRGLKSITHADPQQSSILKLLANGVSVYCPHTSLDAAVGGINDWLACVVSEEQLPSFEGQGVDRLSQGDWQPITPSKESDAQGQVGAGMGRLVNLQQETSFEAMVERVKRNLDLPYVQGCKASDRPIKTVGVCAGSGSSVFRGAKADLLLTGELSHHEVLAYKASGTSVIVTNHTNTERKYLRDVLQHRLRELLPASTSILISQTDADPLSTF